MAVGKTYLALELGPTNRALGSSSPLHMTLTPPITVETAKTDAILAALETRLRGFGVLTLAASEEDIFGPDSAQVRVRKFVPSARLLQLHRTVLGVVQGIVPDIDTTYAGDAYQPHTTYKAGMGVEEGELITMRDVTVLRKEGEVWQRAGIIPLVSE